MKKLLMLYSFMALAGQAGATSYVRLMSASAIHQSARMLFDPNGIQPNVGVTDIAILTHSTADGSIIPKSWQSWCPPENWVPLEIGAGGNVGFTGGRLTGNAVIDAGTSLNIAPQIGSLAFNQVGDRSPPWLQAFKTAFLGYNGSGVSIGGGLAGNIVSNGIFQSAKEALPGRGFLDITKRASRVSLGYSWLW